MTGREFRLARKARGWKQNDVAKRLGVSQTYVALLEHGKRSFTPKLTRRAVSLLQMSPSALPLGTHVSTKAESLTRQLSALGYPGFAHVRPAHRRNPVDVLLAALGNDNLDARVAEALPWLLLQYGVMDETSKKWLVEQARLRGLTNRLGFTVTLAKQVFERRTERRDERRDERASDTYRALDQLEQELNRTRLAATDTFCQNHLSQGQRQWMQDARPEAARHWNLLTNWQPEHLQYA